MDCAMSYRILIVDDSKLARMAIAKALDALRPAWERAEASRADEALALARQSHFDVALIDFNMPERDGLHLAGELRTQRPDMVLAVVSANLQKEVIDRATAVRAKFLPKPVTESAMREFLDDAETHLKANKSR
jgi:DNA-binding NarL/FixJ family response regulator